MAQEPPLHLREMFAILAAGLVRLHRQHQSVDGIRNELEAERDNSLRFRSEQSASAAPIPRRLA